MNQPAAPLHTLGYDALWEWFGLSYCSYQVLPRVLMHEMPDEWQAKMAALLREMDAAFPGFPITEFRVLPVGPNGRMMKAPAWLVNYRRPDIEAIADLRHPDSAEIP